MPRPKEPARVLGPKPVTIRGETLYRVIRITPDAPNPKDRRSAFHYRDEREANEDAAKLRRGIEKARTRSLEDAITAYQQYLDDKGTIGSGETIRRLRAFFPDLERGIANVDGDRAVELYDAFGQRKRQDGEPISASYHRATLINARSLFRWCKKKGWVTSNPFDDVEGVGKRDAGKLQHTGNEVRVFLSHAFVKAKGGDDAALALLMVLYMALRASDVTRRDVRDVDLDGTVLNVWKGKTKKSNRPREIPEELQDLLRAHVKGRSPFDPLFKTERTEDGRHDHHWLWQAMERLCAQAGVPRVCTHALKGTAATLASKAGATAKMVADYLSHEDDGATARRHYVAGGELEAAQARRGLQVISGGRR